MTTWFGRGRVIRALAALVTVMLLLTACTTGPAATAPSTDAPDGSTPTPPDNGSGTPSISEMGEMSLDELAELAVDEGGEVNWYATLNERDTAEVTGAFSARFPGLSITHVHADTGDLVARAIAESQGGRVVADVFTINSFATATLRDEDLLEDWVPPEVSDWPGDFKGDFWYRVKGNTYIIAWNTDQVPSAEAPKTFDDLADPRWNGMLISDGTDVRMLVGLARHKFASEQEAIEWLEAVAANNVQFHSGASNMRALLESGQAAICWSCLSHHYPPIMKEGAPVDYSLEEAVYDMSMATVAKGAPHPATAVLLSRWLSDRDGGQAALAITGNPGHPDVEPSEPIRAKINYPILLEDLEHFERYTEIWNETFGLGG